MGGRIEGRRARRCRVEPGIPAAGEVTVTRADGTTEKHAPLTKQHATKIIRKGNRQPKIGL